MINLHNESHRKMIAKFIQSEQYRLEYNHDIFKILEGNLKEILETRMNVDLGKSSFDQAVTRIAPINIFKKIVTKQTAIYNQTVIRTVENGNEADEKLLRWYEDVLNINQKLHRNNAFFNAYLHALLQITLTDVNPMTGMGKPFLRTAPNHQFLVMSTSQVDPTSPDVIILIMPDVVDALGKIDRCFYVCTNYQFVIMNLEGEVHSDEMARHGQEGINPYGTTPFIHNNASENLSMPMVQTDNREMAVLIPLLLTDLNYAVKFQAFSTFVAIDCDESEVKMSPRSIMHFKSDANGNHPSFDVVKPTIDISETLSLASSQMSLWLTSKGIRPGTVGQLGADQFSSGVSKMIEESDIYESVKEQITVYEQCEKTFWQKLFKQIHPFWIAARRVENTTPFSPGASVKVTYTKPKPLQSRLDMIKELALEVESGFTTVETAVRKLNPEMEQKAIDDLISEAKAELIDRRPMQPLQLAN